MMTPSPLRSAQRPASALLVALVLLASGQCAAQPRGGAAGRRLEDAAHGGAEATSSDEGGVEEPSDHAGHGDGDEESAEESDSDSHEGHEEEHEENHGEDNAEDKHHGDHHAQGHHKASKVDVAIMSMLFGGALLVGVAITILNWNDPDIRVAANQMISVSISIFMAMTMWSEVAGFIQNQLIPSPFPRGWGIKEHTPTYEIVESVIYFILFVLSWVSISWVCHCTCPQDLRLWHGAMKILVPHLVGLIGAEFTMSIQIWAFEESGGSHWPCLLILLFMYVFLQLCKAGTRFWRSASQFQGEHAAAEGEDDATAFIISGGILVWTVCWFHQHSGCKTVESPEHLLQACSESESFLNTIIWLGVALGIFGFLLLIFLIYLSRHSQESHSQESHSQESHSHTKPLSLGTRVFLSLKVLLGFTIGRILLLAVRRCWQEAVPDQLTLAELSTALSISVLAVSLTFAIDKAADAALESDLEEGQAAGHAARSFMGVFGLVVGLSWEEVFMAGNHTLVDSIGELLTNQGGFQEDHEVLLQTFLTVVVMGLVLPLWAKYMIPRAEKSREEHEKDIAKEKEEHGKNKLFGRTILTKLICSCCRCCPCSDGAYSDPTESDPKESDSKEPLAPASTE